MPARLSPRFRIGPRQREVRFVFSSLFAALFVSFVLATMGLSSVSGFARGADHYGGAGATYSASTAEIQARPTTPPSIRGCVLPLVMGDTAGRNQNIPDPPNDITSIDALYVLRGIVNLHRPEPACSAEDIDCDGDRDAVDALWILRWVEQLTVYQHEPCPDIGTELH